MGKKNFSFMPDPEILLWRYNFGPYMETRDKRFRLGNLYEWLTRQMRRVFRIFCKWKLQVNKYVPERLIISLLIMNQRQRASLFSVAGPQSQGRGKLTRSASQGRVGEDLGNEVAQLQARTLVNKKTHPIISPPRIKPPSKSIEMNSIYHDVLRLN